MAFGKSFLVGDEDVGVGTFDPSGKDAFHEDVGVEFFFGGKEGGEWGDCAAVAEGDLEVVGRGDVGDELDIAV